MNTPSELPVGFDQPSIPETTIHITQSASQKADKLAPTAEHFATGEAMGSITEAKVIELPLEQTLRTPGNCMLDQAPIEKQDIPGMDGSNSQPLCKDAEEGAEKENHKVGREQPTLSPRDWISTSETQGQGAAYYPEPFSPIHITAEEALLQFQGPPQGQAYQRRAQPDLHELTPWLPVPVQPSIEAPLLDPSAPEVLAMATVFVIGFFVMMLAFIWILFDLAMGSLAAKVRGIRHAWD